MLWRLNTLSLWYWPRGFGTFYHSLMTLYWRGFQFTYDISTLPYSLCAIFWKTCITYKNTLTNRYRYQLIKLIGSHNLIYALPLTIFHNKYGNANDCRGRTSSRCIRPVLITVILNHFFSVVFNKCTFECDQIMSIVTIYTSNGCQFSQFKNVTLLNVF